MVNIIQDCETALSKAITKQWPDLAIPEIVVSSPPLAEFGDYSSPVALTLAKTLGENPQTVAENIKKSLPKIKFIAEVTVTSPGFVNFILDYPALVKSLDTFTQPIQAKPKLKISVEHTSINPNKAAHIGHLRNVCLGDALVRILRGVGHTVEVQNYIDDLGVQVADSVVAFETYGDAPETQEIDKWFWKIYADINKKYEANPKLQTRREEVLHEMERGESETAKAIVEKMVEAQMRTFARFGVTYDILVYEHDIVKNHLWDKLFEKLKSKKLITQPKHGEHAGTWLVKFGTSEREDKILVKSNGLLTYTAKDLAYALWKFGKTEEMTGYTKRLSPIDRHYNVIDERQSYPQAVVQHVMQKLGFTKEVKNYLHISYGVVKLSHQALKKLGVANDNQAKSMSGRAGIGVMVDDLVDATIAQQIKDHGSTPEVATKIAMGSIRYYMLKTRPLREIVFDFDEALRTDGNTGIYLQYAFARANNILEKVGTIKPLSTPHELSETEKQLVKVLSESAIAMDNAVKESDPSLLCDYAYALASTFAKFYETNSVLKAESAGAKTFRVHLVSTYRATLGQVLDCLGIPTLAKI